MSENGGKVWYIPDCFYHSKSNGLFPSHEAICVINPGERDAEIDITLYFEDREPAAGFKAVCKAERTNHIRMDKLVSVNGEKVPQDVPYAVKVVSNTEIIVQYSRMDTSQSEMALMTTIGYKAGD
jgi:hypothetical protein